jgi:hypothetical protein
MTKRIVVLAARISLLLVLAVATPVLAQEDDNTGTNPLNFTYDARFIFEAAELDDGGSLGTGVFELRAPLGRDIANLQGEEQGLFHDMGSKYGIRFRGRYQSLSVPNPASDPFGTSEVSGIGDFDIRVINLAYTSKRLLIAAGLEAFFDTASNEALGAGTTSLGPQVFFAFPGILGPGSLFVPGYQYVFDIAGDGNKIRRSQIDIYFVWLLAQNKNWLIVDPQIIVDHENSIEVATIEVEFGYMIGPLPGASTYVRPGVGFGEGKPYSWNLEVGLKFVWR